MRTLYKLLIAGAAISISLAAFHHYTYVRNEKNFLPDSKLTPGVVDNSATKEMICTPGYSAKVRMVSASTKKAVYHLYGTDPKGDNYGIDHLISLQLGGSNDIKNLWPLSYNYKITWNKYRKDRLENKLKKLVCENELPLNIAQKEIASNWIDAYKKYVGEK